MHKGLCAVRIFVILLSACLCANAYANDEAIENLARARYAHGDGRAYDAAIHYHNALRDGLPPSLIPIAEHGYCVTRASIQTDQTILDYCMGILRHGGPDGREHPEIIASMLAAIARYSLWKGYYEVAGALIGEFDSRYNDLKFPDLTIERQQIDITRAELSRINRKPAEAMAIAERIVRDGLILEEKATRHKNEVDGMDVMKTLLFAAADMNDPTAIRNIVERFDKVAIQLRSAEGLEYGSVVMLCTSYILAWRVGLDSRKIYGEIIDRTYASMGLLVKAHDLNRQRPLLRHYSHLMQECGAAAFYSILPNDIILELRQKNAGPDDFRQIFDYYDAEQYADTAKAFDQVISAFNEHPGTAASVSANHLALLRKYLLDPPGRRAPG